jgi:hypothetical protein
MDRYEFERFGTPLHTSLNCQFGLDCRVALALSCPPWHVAQDLHACRPPHKSHCKYPFSHFFHSFFFHLTEMPVAHLHTTIL